MRVKFIVPFPLDEQGVRNRSEGLPTHVIHPGIEVKFVPVKNSCAFADSYYDLLILDMFVFEEGLKSEVFV